MEHDNAEHGTIPGDYLFSPFVQDASQDSEFHFSDKSDENLVEQIEDRLHKLDKNGLLHLKSLLSDTLKNIDSRLHGASRNVQLFTPSASNSSSFVSYRCIVCTASNRRTYSTVNTLRRHVESKHFARYDFHCPKCEFRSTRNDVIRNHLRQHGSSDMEEEPQEIKKEVLPLPSDCPICYKSVESWKAFFSCIAHHCVVPSDPHSSAFPWDARRQNDDDDFITPEMGTQFDYSTENLFAAGYKRAVEDDYSGQSKRIKTEPTDVKADDTVWSSGNDTRFKANIHRPQSADAPSTSKASNLPSTPIDATNPQYETSTSIDPGSEHDDGLDFLLNAAEHYEKLDNLELDTARECSIDRVLSHSPDRPEPYSSLEDCIQALLRCISAFVNLQNEGFCERVFTILVEDLSRPDVAEAVHISLEDLESVVTSLSAPRISELGERASAHVLSLMYKLQYRQRDEGQEPFTVPDLAPHEWLPSVRFLCTTLSVGLVSFSGSHVCRFDINLGGEPVETIPVGFGLKFTLRKLACLDDFIGGPAWILGKHDSRPSPETGIKVSLTVQDFNQLWGPIWLLGGTPGHVPVIKTERGFIVPLSDQRQRKTNNGCLPYEVECHWAKEPPQFLPSNERLEQRFLDITTQILIGTDSDAGEAGFIVNPECQPQINSIQKCVASQLQIPGAYRAHYVDDGYAMNLGGGQYVTGALSKSWKRIPARTYKSVLIEHCTKSNAKVIPLLKLQIGLEISACTWNARRISLWDALCLSQTKRANATVASSASCEHCFADCISSCWDKEDNFRGGSADSFGDGPVEEGVLSDYDVWRRITDSILALQHTGVDHKGSLQAWWPFTNTPQTYRMPPNEVNNWFRVVEDSPITATFAVISKRCLELREQKIVRQFTTPCRNGHVRSSRTGLSTRIMLDPLLLSARNGKKKLRDDLPAEEETVGLIQGTKVAMGRAHLTVESGSKGNQRAMIASVSTNPVYRLGARLLAEGKILKAREQVNDEITTGASFMVIVY